MRIALPQDYVASQFFRYGIRPKYNPSSGIYEGECNACMEGRSRGKKRRLRYIPDRNQFYCHNCGRSWDSAGWISEVSGKPISEVLRQSRESDHFIVQTVDLSDPVEHEVRTVADLPEDPINLFDPAQVGYYSGEGVISRALQEVRRRRLDTAINRPRALYVSLKDRIHANRLCIPFFDLDGRVAYYQTRALYREDEERTAKYLSKIGDKGVYGLDAVDASVPYLFIFEGPIDAMFVRNGLAVCGVSMTAKQLERIREFRMHERIWILDNQRVDATAKKVTIELMESGERVFVWPKKFRAFKDLNDLCVLTRIDKVNPKFFVDNALGGARGIMVARSLDFC